MKYTFSHIASILQGSILQQSANPEITHLLIDSRQLNVPETSIFFAIASERRNGHHFISDLYQAGVKAFVISEPIDLSDFPEASILFVPNSVHALQQLVSYHRAQFSLPVIGITGSNGKTIIKEWLNQLLHSDYKIVRSPRSFNSQVGVPLSVWQLNNNHSLGIFEAGISEAGEMIQLQPIIQPTLGVFTNIGPAHNSGFTNLLSKAREKVKLFSETTVIIYCTDYPEVVQALEELKASKQQQGVSVELIGWSLHSPATLEVVGVKRLASESVIKYKWAGAVAQFSIPFSDTASIENSIHCLCVLLHLGYPAQIIHDRIHSLLPVAMRLELKEGVNGCSVINDSYNADLNSLAIALDFLSQQNQHRLKTLVLTDILQSGEDEASLYKEISVLIKRAGISRLFGIGQALERNKEVFLRSGDIEVMLFSSMKVFTEELPKIHFYNEAILLKGARAFGLDEVSRYLEAKVHRTVMEIDLDALVHNLRQYQRRIPQGTKVMAMVKAFSYGSGSYEIANALQFHKVDYLAVAYADEGVELRKGGINLPIMVMNPDESTFNALIQYNLEPEIYSFHLLEKFKSFLQREGLTEFPIHIEIETGMQRLGFLPEETDKLIATIQTDEFKIKSVFTHLVASEDSEHDEFTKQQVKVFSETRNRLEKALPYRFLSHVANSSGISRHPQFSFDMVRLGIGMYGIDNAAEVSADLVEVSTLRTTVSMIKRVKAGETVGYGRNGRLDRDSEIATVRIGYADGYPRSLGNGAGKMLIRNSLAPVVGNVCMDMTMIDVTDIEGVVEDDVVLVFGPQLPAKEVAKWAGTIPYEILTGVSQRVKRVYFRQ